MKWSVNMYKTIIENINRESVKMAIAYAASILSVIITATMLVVCLIGAWHLAEFVNYLRLS